MGLISPRVCLYRGKFEFSDPNSPCKMEILELRCQFARDVLGFFEILDPGINEEKRELTKMLLSASVQKTKVFQISLNLSVLCYKLYVQYRYV